MVETLLVIITLILACAAVAGVVFMLRPAAPKDPGPDEALADLARVQGETAVRLQAMGEMLAARQAELARTVNERLDSVTQRLGASMETSQQHTVENLQKLNERLAVIDSAQKNITDL